MDLKADSDGAWDTTQISAEKSLWLAITGSNAETPKVISNCDRGLWLELPVTKVWIKLNNLMDLDINI